MADPDALDRALRPLLVPGPVVLDGYPRTTRQMTSLPVGFDVVMLEIDQELSMIRANRAAAASGKEGWDAAKRYREQRRGIEQVAPYAAIIINVTNKTPGDVVFEILSSPYIGPPRRMAL